MPLILGTNSIKETSYDVANSCRFNGAINNDETLIKTFGTATNRKKFTFSVWIKLSGRGQGNNNGLLVAGTTGSDEGTIKISNDSIDWSEYDADTASVKGALTSSKLLRDYSAWQHLVFRWDSTDSTAGDRMQIYHNGTRVTAFSSSTNAELNYEGALNSAVVHNIGRQSWNNSGDFNGYMAEIFFIDGTALNADSFGEFDASTPNVWKPKDCKDNFTFGNNGFYLEFKQSGTGTNSSGIGADTSGNNNHFAVNNLTSLSQSIDTCTNNFCTLNKLSPTADITLTEGNLKGVYGTSSTRNVQTSTFGLSSGKWYWEIKIGGSSSPNNAIVGITQLSSDANTVLGTANNSWGYRGYDGNVFHNNADEGGSLDTFTAGDIIGIAINLDNLQGGLHKLYFSKNGTFQNGADPTNFTSTTGVFGIDDNVDYFPAIADAGSSATPQFEMNFGSPSFSISSGNADGEGFGNFEYAPPTGFFAICTKNLAEYG